MKIMILCIFQVLFISQIFGQIDMFEGKWKLIKEKSSNLDYHSYYNIEIRKENDHIILIDEFGAKNKYKEIMKFKPDGKVYESKINEFFFPLALYMGYRTDAGAKKQVTARWDKNNILRITEDFMVNGSQGARKMIIERNLELSYGNNILIISFNRSSRDDSAELKFVFKRINFNNAYFMKFSDNWEIEGELPKNACLISLQGLVNETKPNLYFIYGEKWDFNFTQPLFNFLKNDHYFTFSQLNSLEQALSIFKDHITGYIIWDKNVRSSLGVAYTLAGLRKAIVITEDLIPLMKKNDFKLIEDFRGRFTDQTDYQIYSWAYDNYWKKCSKENIVWLGGQYGKVMKPGIADYGMNKKAFFTDLSFRKTDTLEYALTNKLLSEMKPLGIFWGWHSYKKDWEEESISVTSSYGIRVEPLNSLPNITFMDKIPVSPGFIFKNNHNIRPDKKYIPEKKTYISFVQSDMLGLGAWDKPGRGSIPYAWELNMNWIWLAPVMLEYHYKDATPNDYFIGCLSGPGYLYPNAIPKKHLTQMLEMTSGLMKKVDLNSFEIMDYSTERKEAGISDLRKDVVDLYYEKIPNAIGFVNGYFTAQTFACRNNRPFISYDYYLGPNKPTHEAAADLRELAHFNSDRPYFLLVHVRQSSDVSRVKSIYDKLGEEFEIVPLDIFFKLASGSPTFKEGYLK